ncbi:hypothetical protein TNCV_1965581 [Trichonephila clavipes]|nr:hypothetical protein TNCV_1965581 [Trichonephila clavipes]
MWEDNVIAVISGKSATVENTELSSSIQRNILAHTSTTEPPQQSFSEVREMKYCGSTYLHSNRRMKIVVQTKMTLISKPSLRCPLIVSIPL